MRAQRLLSVLFLLHFAMGTLSAGCGSGGDSKSAGKTSDVTSGITASTISNSQPAGTLPAGTTGTKIPVDKVDADADVICEYS